MHALTAWDLNFQVCIGRTFTPSGLQNVNNLLEIPTWNANIKFYLDTSVA